jgi:hypothetical protein
LKNVLHFVALQFHTNKHGDFQRVDPTHHLSFAWPRLILLLPKPIPGNVPYNKASKARLLGDVPDILANFAITQNPFDFLAKQIEQLQSPIVQLWMYPAAKPVVVVADPATAEEILIHRAKDFDRAGVTKDLFSPVV